MGLAGLALPHQRPQHGEPERGVRHAAPVDMRWIAGMVTLFLAQKPLRGGGWWNAQPQVKQSRARCCTSSNDVQACLTHALAVSLRKLVHVPFRRDACV